MLQTLRQAVVVPRPVAAAALPALTLAAFVWLLVNDAIQPVAVVLLQLYLSF